MLTTLRTGNLTLSSVQYKFDANKRLVIKLTTDGNHKLYGEVNITLANVKAINIYKEDYSLSEDYFNNSFKFERTSATTLEYSETIKSGVTQTESFATLEDNGSDIEATVANSYVDLESGTYNFLLLDTADSEFSTSTIAVKQTDLYGTGVDGLESIFDEDGAGDYLSINNQDLTFDYAARVSINSDDSGVTNIPLLITKTK